MGPTSEESTPSTVNKLRLYKLKTGHNLLSSIQTIEDIHEAYTFVSSEPHMAI